MGTSGISLKTLLFDDLNNASICVDLQKDEYRIDKSPRIKRIFYNFEFIHFSQDQIKEIFNFFETYTRSDYTEYCLLYLMDNKFFYNSSFFEEECLSFYKKYNRTLLITPFIKFREKEEFAFLMYKKCKQFDIDSERSIIGHISINKILIGNNNQKIINNILEDMFSTKYQMFDINFEGVFIGYSSIFEYINSNNWMKIINKINKKRTKQYSFEFEAIKYLYNNKLPIGLKYKDDYILAYWNSCINGHKNDVYKYFEFMKKTGEKNWKIATEMAKIIKNYLSMTEKAITVKYEVLQYILNMKLVQNNYIDSTITIQKNEAEYNIILDKLMNSNPDVYIHDNKIYIEFDKYLDLLMSLRGSASIILEKFEN
jgi:hypothetical protein